MRNEYQLSWIFCLIMALTALFSEQSFAQGDQFRDKITLHNGTVIWGVAELSEENVTMFLTDRDSLLVPLSLIKLIKTNRLNPNHYLERAEGTYYQASVGVMLGKGHHDSENIGSFSGSFTSGYKFNSSLGLGIGLGVNYYEDQVHIPFYLDVQGDFLTSRVTPFYQLSAGWSWADRRETIFQEANIEGGFFLQPSVGMRWHFAKYSWHMKLSYVRQNSIARFDPIDFGNGNILTTVVDRTLQRVGISVGVSF